MTYTDPLGALLGPWACEASIGAALLRIALSMLFGAVIGCERATKRHAAGLRSFTLVSFSTTLLVILEQFLGSGTYWLSAASVVAVSIIAINSVLYSSKNQIKGLTTSIALWACGILGLIIGSGYYTVAALAFLVFLCCLSRFPAFEVYLKNRSNHFEMHIELIDPKYLQEFVTVIRRLGLTINDLEANPAYHGSGLSVYSVALTIQSGELRKYKTHKEIIEAISTLEYIRHIEEIS